MDHINKKNLFVIFHLVFPDILEVLHTTIGLYVIYLFSRTLHKASTIDTAVLTFYFKLQIINLVVKKKF